MKNIFTILTSLLITITGFAQYNQASYGQSVVTIDFRGNGNRSYQVVIDGTSYYSANANTGTWNNENGNVNNSNNYGNNITITNLQPGQHSIQVFRLRNYNSGYGSNNTTPVYSSTFILRPGYDATLGIKNNGQVQFREKENTYNNGRNRDRDYDRDRDRDRDHDGDRDRNGTYNNGYPNNQYNNRMPMNDNQFNQLLQNVRGKWFQSAKVTAVRDAFNTSDYFTTYQITQLLQLISSESSRLDLAKLAYKTVTDPANFTQVYSLFSNQSYRNDLEQYVRTNGGYNNGYYNGGYNNNGYQNNQYPNNYNNRMPMTDADFNQLLQRANSHVFAWDKVKDIREDFSNTGYYFSASQIKQLLSLVTTENDRLDLAKLSYRSVTDPANFTQVYSLFPNQTYRNDLEQYVRANGGYNNGYYNNQYSNNYNNRMPMTDADFNQLLQKANSHIFPWDKVRDVREDFTNTNYYFSTSQIRQLLSIITTESDRLDLAKISYRSVTDPNNFSQLYDLFTTQANRDELDRYVRSYRQ